MLACWNKIWRGWKGEGCLLGAQFERTLIVAEDDAEVSYLEGCTAPSYDKNQVCPACSCGACKQSTCCLLWNRFQSHKQLAALQLHATVVAVFVVDAHECIDRLVKDSAVQTGLAQCVSH